MKARQRTVSSWRLQKVQILYLLVRLYLIVADENNNSLADEIYTDSKSDAPPGGFVRCA